MLQTIEVEVDEQGQIHPLEPLPAEAKGRALLTFLPRLRVDEVTLLSEAALAEDWLRPEEDEAWSQYQPVR